MNLLEQYKQIKYPLEKKGYALACQQTLNKLKDRIKVRCRVILPENETVARNLILQDIKELEAVVELAKEEGHL